VILSGHKKRVDVVQFHPTAYHIIASGSTDKSVKIWDIEAGIIPHNLPFISKGKEQLSLDSLHTDVVNSLSWNYNGSLLATVSKDKKIRVIDPRANSVIQVTRITASPLFYRWEKHIKE
jgi:coronin-1B/1C/6